MLGNTTCAANNWMAYKSKCMVPHTGQANSCFVISIKGHGNLRICFSKYYCCLSGANNWISYQSKCIVPHTDQANSFFGIPTKALANLRICLVM